MLCCAACFEFPPDIGPDICFPQKMEKKNLGVTNSSSCLVLIGMLAFFRVALEKRRKSGGMWPALF